MARLLRYGSQGTDVEALQQALQGIGYEIGADGKFGRETLSAVNNFQTWWGLTVDGIVGPGTSAALQQAFNGATPSDPGTAAPDTWVAEEWYLVELPDDDEYAEEDDEEDDDEEGDSDEEDDEEDEEDDEGDEEDDEGDEGGDEEDDEES